MENKKDIKDEKKDNNTSEKSNKEMTKITQRIFVLRNKEEGDTTLCRVNLRKVTDLTNKIHISYNIFGTEEIYTSENALKYGIIGEEEIKKFLAQPLAQNNKETKKENLEIETIKEISKNTNEILTIKDNEKKEDKKVEKEKKESEQKKEEKKEEEKKEEGKKEVEKKNIQNKDLKKENKNKENKKKEDEKEESIPKFNSLFPDVENEIYIIETKVKLLKEMNLPEYIKEKLEFIDIPGQKFPYEITNIIDEFMCKTNIYLIFFSFDKNGEADSKEFEQNYLYLNAALSRRKILDNKNPPPLNDNYIFLINKFDKCCRRASKIRDNIKRDINKKVKMNKKDEKKENERIEFNAYIYSNKGKLGKLNYKEKNNKKISKKYEKEKKEKEESLKESENLFKISLLQKIHLSYLTIIQEYNQNINKVIEYWDKLKKSINTQENPISEEEYKQLKNNIEQVKNKFDKAKLTEEIDNIKKVCIKKAEEIYNKGDDKIMNKKGKKNEKELKKELEDFLKNEMNDLINKKIPNTIQNLKQSLDEIGKNLGDLASILGQGISFITNLFSAIMFILPFYALFSGIVITAAFIISAIAETSIISGALIAGSVASALVFPITAAIGTLTLVGFGIYTVVGLILYNAMSAFLVFFADISIMIIDTLNVLNIISHQIQEAVETTKLNTIELLEETLLLKMDPINIEKKIINDSDSNKMDLNFDLDLNSFKMLEINKEIYDYYSNYDYSVCLNDMQK